MKRVAILQSAYIPWKGYFDILHSVDEFILYDDAQYTVRDWRNRNRVKTPQGLRWLTIPVRHLGRSQRIRDTRSTDPRWRRRHWECLRRSYARAPYFHQYRSVFEPLYLGSEEESLSRINAAFLAAVAGILGIRTLVRWSWDYEVRGERTERLLHLCQQAGADEYLSGPAAKSYLDEARFAAAGIRVRWMSYAGYPEYRQLHPPFEHCVSILDLLFCEGPNSPSYMLSFGKHDTARQAFPPEAPSVRRAGMTDPEGRP
ncbi:MAG: WbqC family protein [Lentisphaeria bacterium]|nr:WbqC family protein [Lentisphaeria bacterium]